MVTQVAATEGPNVLFIAVDVHNKRSVGVAVLDEDHGAITLTNVQEDGSNEDIIAVGPDYVVGYIERGEAPWARSSLHRRCYI